MSYDRADFDYSTEAEPLPKGHAATHIGMFLAWAVLNELESDFHRERSTELLARLRRREITGRQFFEAACSERFSERDLNEEGNAFAQHYYVDEAGSAALISPITRKSWPLACPVSGTWQTNGVTTTRSPRSSAAVSKSGRTRLAASAGGNSGNRAVRKPRSPEREPSPARAPVAGTQMGPAHSFAGPAA